MENALGRNMYSYSFALTGLLSAEQWCSFLDEVTQAIGMTPVYSPAVWRYPLCGAGGTGETIVQPITESFLAVDTWPDHGGAYLLVCSCRPFDPHVIQTILAKWKLGIGGEVGHTLRIPSEAKRRVA